MKQLGSDFFLPPFLSVLRLRKGKNQMLLMHSAGLSFSPKNWGRFIFNLWISYTGRSICDGELNFTFKKNLGKRVIHFEAGKCPHFELMHYILE